MTAGQQCPRCGSVNVGIVHVPNNKVKWDQNKTFIIDDEWTQCRNCEEEFYTMEQAITRDDKIRIARGMTVEQCEAEREVNRLRWKRPE